VTIVVDISPVVDYSSDEQWFYILLKFIYKYLAFFDADA